MRRRSTSAARSFGTGSGPAARTFGRAGGGVVSYDGMIWDQTYGDFGTYEEAQITTAAKGADAMNPGVTMNLVVKSGSNTFKGLGLGELSVGRSAEQQHHAGAAGKGLRARRQQVHQPEGLLRRSRRADPARIACGSTPAIATPRRATSFPGFIQLSDRQQVEFYTKLQDPTGEDHLPDQQEQQVRRHGAGRPQVAAVSHGEPLRPARIDAEPGLDVADRPVVQVPVDPVAARDVRRQRAAWRLLVARHSVDAGCPQDRPRDHSGPTRGAFLETDRKPRRWQYGGTFAYFAEAFGRNHELKTGYLGWRNIVRHREHRLSEPAAVSLSQPRRAMPNCDEAHNYDGCFTRPDSVLVYDYPNTTASGEWYNSLYLNDKITVSRKLTLNVGVRYDRYSSFLPEQGNPGTGPFATHEHLSVQGRGATSRSIRRSCRACRRSTT